MKTLYIMRSKSSSVGDIRIEAYRKRAWILDCRPNYSYSYGNQEWRPIALLTLGSNYQRIPELAPNGNTKLGLAKVSALLQIEGDYTNALIFIRGCESENHLNRIASLFENEFPGLIKEYVGERERRIRDRELFADEAEQEKICF